MGIETIVGNIVSALFYDTGKAVVKDMHNPSQEEELKQALKEFLERQMMQYGADGAAVIEEIPDPVRKGRLYYDVVNMGADRDKLLNQWMEKCETENYDKVRATCRGCIDIIITHIKYWPEFLADMTISTNSVAMKMSQNIEENKSILLGLTSESTEDQNSATVTSRTPEYKGKWNEPLFLNNPSEYREVNSVCPEDVYVPHRYLFGNETEPSDETKYPLMSELAKSGGHLVLGDPGIGKSTLISWYLNKSCDSRTKQVYRLTDFDISGEEKQPGVFLLKQMGMKPEQLTNTILFLDGLDECGLSPEDRVRFLRELYSNWQSLKKKNFSWVVTCRMNYISEEQIRHLRISCITLLPLKTGQIEEFLQKFEGILGHDIPEKKRTALLSEKNTGNHGSPFGIPLILYMAAATDIKVTENSTLVDVYDQLFPALYQRSSSYDVHEQQIVYHYRKEIHQMSRDIALWMLLHKSKTASISGNAYEEIEKAFGGDIAEGHTHQIGSYFRALHHTEGKTELCFIHRTMFEYFVADGFVHRAINAKTPEELSRIIAWYWYAEKMEDTMQQYVNEKLRKKKNALKFPQWKEAGLKILEKGVHRCWQGISDESAEKSDCSVPTCLLPHISDSLEDDRHFENTAFWNLCHLLFWVRNTSGITEYIFKSTPSNKITKVLSRTIRHCSADSFPIYCPAFSLSYARLSRTILSHAILTGADLSYAHLSLADLSGADLTRANLTGANISDANLTGAVLSKKQVQMLGYEKLQNCRFENIRIGSSSFDSIKYTRKCFFQYFFPKRKYPRGKK